MLKTVQGCNQKIQNEGNSTRQSSGFLQLNYEGNQKQRQENLYIKIYVCAFGQDGSSRDQIYPPP